MKRLLYRANRIASTLRYWAQRRFTPMGWLVLIGLVLTAVIGTDTEQAMAYQAFTLLFCLLGSAFLWAPFFPGQFAARRILPRFGSVGETVHYSVRVRNDGAKYQVGLALRENLADPRPTYAQFVASIRPAPANRSFRIAAGSRQRRAADFRQQPLPALPPRSETEVPMSLTPLRRGALHFTGIALARPDPFGLIQALRLLACPQTLLILPKRYPLPPIALPGTRKYQQGGVTLASAVGQSDEFVALRDYRRGDPLQHIHWKSWARTGRPIVKEFQDEFFVRHALILDTFEAAIDDAAFEDAVSVAASFACTLPSQESLLDLMFVGTEAFCFTAGRGLARGDQMLEILASVQMCRTQSFGTLRDLVLRHAAGLSGCVCVFLAWDAQRMELVQRLKALGLPLLVLVVTSEDHATPLDPGPLRAEPRNLRQLVVGRIATGLAAVS